MTSQPETACQDARSRVTNRIRQSKWFNRFFAATAVAAGITFGLSHKDAPEIVAGGATLGSIGGALAERRLSRRHCEKIVTGYCASVGYVLPQQVDQVLTAPLPTVKKINRKIDSFIAQTAPVILTLGTTTVLDYALNRVPGEPQTADNIPDSNLLLGGAFMWTGVRMFQGRDQALDAGLSVYIDQLDTAESACRRAA